MAKSKRPILAGDIARKSREELDDIMGRRYGGITAKNEKSERRREQKLKQNRLKRMARRYEQEEI